MIHPLQLPRTLRGAGGIRLINMPGVRYPDEVLQGPSGTGASRTCPLRKAPPGFISSQNAAELLGITPRSARAMLARRNTRRVMVREPGKAACVYWERLKVQELLETRCPLVRNLPARFCDSAEACYILMIARSTLHRYVKQGALKEYQVRRAFAGGVHREAYYLRAEVRKLAAMRNAARARTETARRERISRLWEEHVSRKSSRLSGEDKRDRAD